MTRIHFFLAPNRFFQAVAHPNLGSRCRIIFRRYASEGRDAQFEVVDHLDCVGCTETYLVGGYSEIYFSLQAIPAHKHDWDFPTIAQRELLLLEGGRSKSNLLELSKLRVFAKVSRVRNAFLNLANAIQVLCTGKSVSTLTGVRYDKILFEPQTANDYKLTLSLDESSDPAFLCVPVTANS